MTATSKSHITQHVSDVTPVDSPITQTPYISQPIAATHDSDRAASPGYLRELDDLAVEAVGPGDVVEVDDGLLVGRCAATLHQQRRVLAVVAEQIVADVRLQGRGQPAGVGQHVQAALVVPQ